MQLDLFVDFKPQPPACEIVRFPLARNSMVNRVAARLRSIRIDAERSIFFKQRLHDLRLSRVEDGLTWDEAVADVAAFKKAVMAEYWRPSPPHSRRNGLADTIPFPQVENAPSNAARA